MDNAGLGTIGDIMREDFKKMFQNVPVKKDDTPMSDVKNFWHHAHPEVRRQDIDSNKVGKWMIFSPNERVDEVWEKVKTETENDRLGISAKCATARPNAIAKDPNIKLICIYTYDYEDKDDVFRVRELLKEMGFNQTLYYKSDSQTANGKYGKGSWIYRG